MATVVSIAAGRAPADMRRESLITAMLVAYKANKRRYQGFYYCPRHVIRDLTREGKAQIVWEAYGAGNEYEAARDAMMVEVERLRFGAVLDAVMAWAPRPMPESADAEGAV